MCGIIRLEGLGTIKYAAQRKYNQIRFYNTFTVIILR